VVVELGGGRRRVEDAVDPAVGISSIAEPGCPLDESTPLAVIHAADEKDWETAAARLRSAFAVTDEPPETRPVLRGKVEGKK
jgi:thymidine phosphorylase